MKKLVVGVLVLALGFLGAPTVHAADTDNYTISSYNVDMTLSTDSENRSTLSTKETITAVFPETDQNHGLERVFVTSYNGHSTSLTVQSVTDENGVPLPYHWVNDAIRIGDGDSFVHGSHTYVLTYTQRDVTRYYANTDRDEFYWDAIGQEVRVPIENATVRLTIDRKLISRLTGNSACYQGSYDATVACNLTSSDNVYTATVTNLWPSEGVTVVLGFSGVTFAAYQQTLFEKIISIWAIVQIVALVISAGVVLLLVVRWRRATDRATELGTIVPEYLPPEQASVMTSARLLRIKKGIMTAQLLDLAVRHYITISEVKEKTAFAPAKYEIKVIKDMGDLRWEEQQLLRDEAGLLPPVGTRQDVARLAQRTVGNYRYFMMNTDLDESLRGEYGLREANAELRKRYRRIALAMVVLAVLLLSPVVFVVFVISWILSRSSYTLTDKGLALRRYLTGLKMYISVAEEERIRMLQSPDGAEKVRMVVNGIDQGALIKLYERVLPYAVLFGQEKEWNKQLGRYYEAANTSPDWYTGQSAAFNAVLFSNAMSSFSQSNTYASSSSSSSGGSDGGGFAGGGGGGGGVGGW